MYRALACLLVVISTSFGMPIYADSRIEMLDGSTVNGDVVSFSNGRYVIDSPSLGRLEIDESAIRTIEPSSPGRQGGGNGAQIQSFQQQILANPTLVEMIMRLQSDPALQSAVNDPNIMHLIMSGNLEALKSNPRFLEVLDNPSIQAIVREVNLHR